MHTYIHTYRQTHIHTYIHAYIHTYIHTHMHTYIRTYIHTYLHTYMHTYIHVHIHKYPGITEGGFFRASTSSPQSSSRYQNGQTSPNAASLPAKKRSRENDEFAPNSGANTDVKVPSVQDWKSVGVVVGQGTHRKVLIGLEFAPSTFNVASKVGLDTWLDTLRVCMDLC